MKTGPEKFEINSDGINYRVERSASDKNIFWLYCATGTYMVAKDFYNVWVELTRKKGSADIPLTEIGRVIEDFSNDNCPA